jgi:hypothetical protein
MKYKIEKNIEQIGRKKGGRSTKYPFHKMEVGDSFIIHKKYTRLLMTYASNAGRKYGAHQNPIRKFIVRK